MNERDVLADIFENEDHMGDRPYDMADALIRHLNKRGFVVAHAKRFDRTEELEAETALAVGIVGKLVKIERANTPAYEWNITSSRLFGEPITEDEMALLIRTGAYVPYEADARRDGT